MSRGLPYMVVDKECLPLLMKLVTSLASEPSTVPLRLTLLAKLWRVESRRYPFLQKDPLEPTPSTSATEYQITQAAVIRDTESTHAVRLGPPAQLVQPPQSVQWTGGNNTQSGHAELWR